MPLTAGSIAFTGFNGDGNDNLNVARVNINPSPTGFSNKVTLSDTSPKSPALGELNAKLYIAWKGDGNDLLNVMFSTDGVNFGNKSIGSETSPQAPSLVNHNGDLYIGWKGDGNDNLNVARVTDLPAPAYVYQTNITNFPVKPGDTVTVNQVIVEIETAKSLVELPSPFEGVVTDLLVSEGQSVDVGTPIIAVDVSGEGGSGGPGPHTEVSAGSTPAETSATAQAAAAGAQDETAAREPGIEGSPAPKIERQAVLVGYGVKLGTTTRRPRKGKGKAGGGSGGC